MKKIYYIYYSNIYYIHNYNYKIMIKYFYKFFYNEFTFRTQSNKNNIS